jgi:hypothetical protein
MGRRLYIIGNGFDLHHGVNSRYSDFGHFLQGADSETYEQVQKHFEVDEDFWSEFEDRLASFDVGTAIDDAEHYLLSYGDDEWSDSAHHDYQEELTTIVRAISVTLRQRFAEWIRHLPIPKPSEVRARMLPLDNKALYLNFNYTTSLQELYGVPEKQILHIHGCATDSAQNLVLGHGWERKPSDSLNFKIDPMQVDTRVRQGNQILDEYFSMTFKPTAEILRRHTVFFESLGGIDAVYVMGHSLSAVDIPYFQAIVRNIKRDARWTVSFHADADLIRKRFGSFCVGAIVEFRELENF